ncbi:MAG: glycine cleavage T C-terminal barrel domain-containing protein [Candidatus Calescibacterium sp.]|nr:glycine cleavage system protein T [Candidatus Calescibacterium sp.]MDW8195305.1 glycine cleavage T C-terminal barrel domain-containing protein [Candidatus Calescibacterium sp.]
MKQSIFHELYQRMGAKFTDFLGYLCPLYYRGIIDEVLMVRNRIGIFDLFHMGRIIVYKNGNFSNLQKILSVKIDSIRIFDSNKGKAKYCLILNDKGTIEDDIVIYDLTDKMLIVCNACNKEKNISILKSLDLEFRDLSDELMMLAIQGPLSSEAITKFLNIDLSDVYFYEYVVVNGLIISRTGYTGEDGFEVYSNKDNIYSLLKWIKDNYGNVMCGLGARDVLRIEAGLPLYGNEIDDNTTPADANLEWAVNIKREFKRTKYLKYFQVNGSRKIPRKGDEVYIDGLKAGYITSGTFSPILQKPIGMMYVNKLSNSYMVKDIYLDVSDNPFITTRYYKRGRG